MILFRSASGSVRALDAHSAVLRVRRLSRFPSKYMTLENESGPSRRLSRRKPVFESR